jgi:glycosyltransferase involved in cell wall biosynthesis
MALITEKSSPKQLRIVMVSPSLGTAFGLEQVLMQSVRGLRGRGHSVFLIGEKAHESLPSSETPVLIPALFSHSAILNPLCSRQILKQFQSALEGFSPDLVHFLDQPLAQAIDYAATHYPCVLTSHTVAPTCPASHRLIQGAFGCEKKAGWGCLYQNKNFHCLDGFKTDTHRAHVVAEFQLKRKATQKIKAIVAISRYIEATLLKNGFSEEQVKLIYNPLPKRDDLFAPKAGAAPPSPLLVSACRLVPLKGIEFAIRALKDKKHLDWTYWILGEGELKEPLIQLVSDLNLETRIHFKGKLSHAETLKTIQSAHIFLQPNVGPEGFGLSVAEAISLGVPAIAFDAPALNEIIEENKNGLLVPLYNKEALGNAIEKLLTEPSLRDRLSAYGKTVTPHRFSEAFFLDSTLHLYGEILKSSNSLSLLSQTETN